MFMKCLHHPILRVPSKWYLNNSNISHEPLNVNELTRLSTLNSTLRKREQEEQIIIRP